jgi:flagellar basal-body rod protein FlgB
MDLSNLKLFHAMKENMDWLSQRQRVIAQNIANADTPNYEVKDLKALDFRNVINELNTHTLRNSTKAISLTLTNEAQIKGTLPTEGFKTKRLNREFETTITGNGVKLEDQAFKMSQTSDAYKLSTQLYKKYTDLMRLAVKGTQG